MKQGSRVFCHHRGGRRLKIPSLGPPLALCTPARAGQHHGWDAMLPVTPRQRAYEDKKADQAYLFLFVGDAEAEEASVHAVLAKHRCRRY